MNPVNLAAALARFDDLWSPKAIADVNDYQVKLVKVRGEFVWHTHDETDELFLVLHGSLAIRMRDRDVSLDPGDLFVVPRGVEHCPVAIDEAHVLLLEPATTVNTGGLENERTAATRRLV